MLVSASKNLLSLTKKQSFEKIPEQKIDITVATSEEVQSDDFLISVMDYAVKF
ncbi:MAG: hypothetical protein H7328_05030 [Bdellovibrio sp.]|nr:hypothetical protein [Bdellovibrio sp.]